MNAMFIEDFKEIMDYVKSKVDEDTWNQINTYGMTTVFSNTVDIYGVKTLRLPDFLTVDNPVQIDIVEEYVVKHGYDCVMWKINIDGVIRYAIKCFNGKCNFRGCKTNGYCFECSDTTIITTHVSEAEVESAILDATKKE